MLSNITEGLVHLQSQVVLTKSAIMQDRHQTDFIVHVKHQLVHQLADEMLKDQNFFKEVIMDDTLTKIYRAETYVLSPSDLGMLVDRIKEQLCREYPLISGGVFRD